MIALVYVLLSLRLAPTTDVAELRNRFALGQAAEDAGASMQEARWLSAVAFRESTYRMGAVGKLGEVCAMQILLPGATRAHDGSTRRELASSVDLCTREALHQFRASARACPSFPLAIYAGGPKGCTMAKAQRISRDRERLAKTGAQ